MKGDYTRSTFNRKKHYSGVRMQQGRVQLDADWNEQVDLIAHRAEAETIDVIGHCGAPMHRGGFHLVAKIDDLTTEEKARPENQNPPTLQAAGDFYISCGHCYVDGLLCENEHIVPFAKQPDLPGAQPVDESGTYLAYLDVWSRHITALEDPQIREVALGGPDTATRTKTIWQVKLHWVGDVGMDANCLSAFGSWKDEIEPGDGKLAAQAEAGAQSTDPCIVAPGAGYRRLENQLYRVEVHNGGKRGTATFKWSRDNGSVVTKWEKQDVNKLTVSSTGRDKMLGFASGQWVELIDDIRELLGEPGTLVQLAKVEGQVLTIDPATATGPVDLGSFPDNPRVRRWDMPMGQIKPTNSQWVDLEDGVQVRFSTGSYKTGDYWLIPARTANADVEWPLDQNTNQPELQSPHGMLHHYCRLALMRFNGTKWTEVIDCRHMFPPVTELTSLFYVSGDGQEAMPGKVLSKPLQVGVSNGQWPVLGAKIRFKRLASGGALLKGSIDPEPNSNAAQMDVRTNDKGVADIKWQLDANVANQSQQVEATLLDADDKALHLPIRFTANLSLASQVAYDPTGCTKWADASKIKTVEDAINELCAREQKGGCAVTIGKDGQYTTLKAAFDAKKDARDICFCLLPGDEHIVEEDIDEKEKNTIKIVGCSASIRLNANTLSLSANKIVLLDFDSYTEKNSGRIRLAGNEVTVNQCAFTRLAESEGPPFVLIEPLSPGESKTILHWKNGRLSAGWRKQSPRAAENFFEPVSIIAETAKAIEGMIKLSKTDPIANKKAFNSTLDETVKTISKLSPELRNNWVEKSPKERIGTLETHNRKMVNSLFNTLKKRKIDTANLRRDLAAAIAVFYNYGYTQALALSYGVGGWIEDNTIDGYLTLHYYPKFTPLSWQKATEETLANRRSFLKLGREYINVDPVTLNLRGNSLYAVHSNGYSIMQVMNQILTTGDWGDHDMPETGYEFLTVTGNVFEANGSGFVSQSLIMTENTFANKANQDLDIAAYVLGYPGVFVGNVGATQSLDIETMLRPGWVRESANLISIIQ